MTRSRSPTMPVCPPIRSDPEGVLPGAYSGRGVRSRLCRSGAANGSDRRSGPEATACLRPGAGRDHRQSDLTTAVRVDRAAGPRIYAGADGRSAGGTGTAGVRRIRTRPRRCRTIEIVTKQKRSAGPARTPSKARSRSGNPAVRAGEAGPVATARSLDPPQIASRPKPPAAVVDPGALPPDGAAYPQIMRGESYVWWRSVAGVVFAISLFALVTMVVSQALVMLFWATTAGNQPYRTTLPRRSHSRRRSACWR